MKRYTNIYHNNQYFEVRDEYMTRVHVYRVPATCLLKDEYNALRSAAALSKFMTRIRQRARRENNSRRAPHAYHFIEYL